ncbi:GNAT family N-acetyltransferase [Bacillus taeanensis]|uniref:N-acetyltransferase domain-containing protein n=1 Tax=Bacillus taeanensis TaxID=273032 RepID=A0A366XT72_9BACI|nr:GNAT family N-acetyltransferase [Bacillus taeanensis]RBW69342.1 hypothetical protein DS031_11940 [Bacillus taeanensis]
MFAIILDENNKENVRADLNHIVKELSLEDDVYQNVELYWEKVEDYYPIGFIDNGKYLGFCLLQYSAAEKVFFIQVFYIKPKYQGQGLGSKAVEKLKGFCLSLEENPVIKISFSTTLSEANLFFEKQGFELENQEKDKSVYVYGQK